MPSPNLLRNIPSVTELLENPRLKGLVDRVSHNVVVDGVRTFLDDLREEVQKKASEVPLPPVGELAERIARRILQQEQPQLRPVINAGGVLLHTGLGRAPLAEPALDELLATARGYASVELDLASGERSRRTDEVARLLCGLTGAEAALVVNNNAAATLLTLAALAGGLEVVVSRGQLVEIGGSYRLPDVMSASGAILKEVGTTNKTRPKDYEQAIGEETAALMRVHTSNYRIVGFSAEASLEALVEIGRRHSLPVIDDIGSGALVDLQPYGITDEPLAARSIALGADVVLFSGDKLLGGPQCGVIVGRRNLVAQITAHPLARAVRVGKLTLATLAATLRLYRDPKAAARQVPLLELLSTPTDNLRHRAERLAPQLESTEVVAEVEVVEETSQIGGGSVPGGELPTWCVAVLPAEGSVDALARRLRTGTPAVVGRVQQERLLLDLRTVFPREDQQLVAAFESLGG